MRAAAVSASRAGGIGAGPELGVDERGDGSLDGFGAGDAGLRGADGFLGGGQGQEGIGGGDGYFILRPVEGCCGLLPGCFRGGDVGAAQAKIERLPGDQGADGAAPGGA